MVNGSLWSPAAPRSRGLGQDYALAIGIVGAATLAAFALRPHVAATNLAMVYLLGVVAIALGCSRHVAVAASFLSVAAFDFFCVPPYLTLRVSDYEYLITFSVMLVVALVISTQTARVRLRAAEATGREARTDTLYRLSSRLAGQTSVFAVAQAAAEFAEEVFGAQVAIFLPEDGTISFSRRSRKLLPFPRTDEAVAQRVLDRGQTVATGGTASPVYFPLRGSRDVAGVMGVLPMPGAPFTGEQRQLLEVFASHAALVIERTRSQHAAEDARVKMHAEEMRSSLLSTVSHDLRTPLASITGAASTLRAQGERLEPQVREELLESIADEADRLSRLVGNLLDMTRLESGVKLRRDFYPLEEIVGAALQRMERQMGTRPVTTDLPSDLPLVYVDDVLLGQLVVNLLENALKYTPAGAPIELTAAADGDAVVLEIRDRGPGFTPGEERRVFEKFYRGKSDGVRGVGLGLAICRAIVEAHHGTIEALNREGGGAVFRMRLPLASS